jgi:hypothetical protein
MWKSIIPSLLSDVESICLRLLQGVGRKTMSCLHRLYQLLRVCRIMCRQFRWMPPNGHDTDLVGICDNVAKYRLTGKKSSLSDTAYCHRYTHSGYSIYACGPYPTAVTLSMTFFSSNTDIQKQTTSRTMATADSGGVSGCPTISACPNSIYKPVPAGTIAGSVVGGLFILVAGAVGLAFMLRQNRKPPPAPQVGAMNATISPASPAPYLGHLPQQPVADSHPR